ncbi:MAG: T9SS type A sorting domain-containing protein [Bacteroidales bacterium]|nr:T9SS type A sorting domain-containing protein [Bacteroidales bacterium]
MEYCIVETNGNLTHHQVEYFVPLIWLIIRRDCDTCPTVQGLQYVKSGAGKAFFKWQNGTNHRDWQLSYGPAGTAPEDGTIVDCIQRMTGNIEFDPDSHYVAYVRARCRFARYEYGPWSAPLDFCLNGSGIDEAGATDITLTPNPAADRVTVAAEGMESVELIGVDGAVLQRKECRNTCVLDLRGLAAGVYMVRVGTARGTATKRLVVQ